MKINRIIQGLLIILIAQSCATKKLTQEGTKAYEKGAYDTALTALGQVIEKHESKDEVAQPEIYYKAGMAAMNLENYKKASEYLERAEYLKYNPSILYVSLAKIYKTIDNLSKEIEALEDYREKHPDGKKINSITVRLFETYVQSENWKKAVDLWPELTKKAQSDIELLAGYLVSNRELENDKKCDKLANQILKREPENIAALEWFAKSKFWEAENTYVREMKAYKNNRTNSQYKKLLKAWDGIWETFRSSRDYFLKLYELDPKPEYAKFLGNIYKRLDKNKKAEYYYRKAE